MKTASDPRHLSRQYTVQAIFEWQFRKNKLSDQTAKKVLENIENIDPLISKAAPEWPVEKISHIDLAILRLAVYELTVARKQPVKVIIDEAVELSKEFGGEKSSQFINGALGKVALGL